MYPHQEQLNRRSALNSSRGFTLIEALVALVILTLALVPALIFASSLSATTSVAKNNLVAINLAQEGVEVVRALRDINWFNNSAFNNGLDDGIYRVEWNSNFLIALETNPPLKVNNGLYNYSAGTDTIFQRTITLTNVNSGEIRVVSNVIWTERGNRARDVMVESHLFNWK